jgi:hypothetical protein
MADNLTFLGEVVNNLSADEAKEIKEKITAEMARRNVGFVAGYEGYTGSYDPVSQTPNPRGDANFDLEFSSQDYIPLGEPGSDEPVDYRRDLVVPNGDDRLVDTNPDNAIISYKQGRKIIHPLLNVCDKGDLIFVVPGDILPSTFDKDELNDFLLQLESESTDGNGNIDLHSCEDSSCRSACTGLCVGTCGDTCAGCTEMCVNMCTGCGACTAGCTHHCGMSCTGSCVGECTTSCGGGCTGGCTGECTGCKQTCYAACGGSCTTGCTTSCKGGAGSGVSSSSCRGSCSAECRGGSSGTNGRSYTTDNGSTVRRVTRGR